MGTRARAKKRRQLEARTKERRKERRGMCGKKKDKAIL